MMTRMFLTMWAAAALALSAVMAGCASVPAGAQGPAVGGAVVAAPGSFSWASQSLETAGRGTVPANVSLEPQRSMVGRQAAKTVAITALKRQVASLPVNDDLSVGSFMDENITLKRSMEQYVQGAMTVSEQEVSPGVFEVRVRLALSGVADILRRHYITADNLPAPPPESEPGIPPVI